MQFQSSKGIENIGKVVGFLFSYFIFTAILFLILSFTGKLAANLPLVKVFVITAIITITGYSIKRLLQ